MQPDVLLDDRIGNWVEERDGRRACPYRLLVPLLTQHVADHLGLFIYYGSRTAQPTRARAFIDFVVDRIAGNAAYVLNAKELAMAEAKGRTAHRCR